ncbi:DNA/RNA nuclease SfsA [Thermodesulfovibrio hydrogeniphilus]
MMKFDFKDLKQATLIKRVNRFVVECNINGKKIYAHLPNSGSLMEYMIPGEKIYLKQNNGLNRATQWSTVAIEKDGFPVFIQSAMTNSIVEQLLNESKIEEFKVWKVLKREIKYGSSRFDLLLSNRKEKLLIEVKSCTRWGSKIAMFPDAITERGRKQIIELSMADYAGGVFFIVHTPKVDYFLPDYHTDLSFSETLFNLKDKLIIRAYSIIWSKHLTFSGIKEINIPWHILNREMKDSGSYLLIVKLEKDLKINVGNLGEVYFRKGYYVYVGSAMKALSKRIQRHRIRRKKLFWHVDYLREEANFIDVLPIRTHDRLECEIARRVEKISEWSVSGFGASDCKCKSHLYGFSENPLINKNFIDLLFYFRIDRLNEKYSL